VCHSPAHVPLSGPGKGEATRFPAIQDHLAAWEALLTPERVPRVVRTGVVLDLKAPVPPMVRRQFPLRADLAEFREATLREYLSTQRVEPVPQGEQDNHVYLQQFVVDPKPPAKKRLVTNAQPVNRFWHRQSFKLESVRTLLAHTERDDWIGVLDISAAYTSFELAPETKRLFAFKWKGQRFRHTRMIFGDAAAPRLFCKTLRPVVEALRKEGISLFSYLDDFAVRAHSRAVVLRQMNRVAQVLRSLGFTINEKKMQPPTRCPVFLGYRIDTRLMRISPRREKVSDLRRDAARLLKAGHTSARRLASFLGKATFCLTAARHGKHMKAPIIRLLKVAARDAVWDRPPVPLTAEVAHCLRWWIHEFPRFVGRDLEAPQERLRVITDAGPTHWGAVIRQAGQPTCKWFGRWTRTEKDLHQNCKEAMGVLIALQGVQHRLHRQVRLQVVTDSRVVFHCMRRGRSRSPTLSPIIEEIMRLAATAADLRVQWCSSQENHRADWLSRYRRDRYGWELTRRAFESIIQRLDFAPTVDLFASRVSARLPRYCALEFDPLSQGDAFDYPDWRGAYAFPPPIMLNRLWQEWRVRGRPPMLWVVPHWPAQPWFYPLWRAATAVLPLDYREVRDFEGQSQIPWHTSFIAVRV
jgi:reverse transcriptase-like protein